MYPAIIIGDNISPETKIVKEVMDERVVSFRKDYMGLIPRVIKLSLDARDNYRQLRLAATTEELRDKYAGMEKSAKVGANATYGILLYPPFRLYDKDCADAVTRSGRRIIRRLHAKCLKQNIKDDWLRKIIEEVLYGDTDSIFILLNCSWKDEKSIAKVSNYLNNELKKLCKELGYTEEVEGKVERVLDRLFFKFRPAKKEERKHAVSVGGRLVVGTKKKYAGRCRWIEGKGRVSEKYIKGFGRSDISRYTKGIYESIWDALLERGDVDLAIKLLRRAWIDIKKQNWYDISVPRGVKGNIDEYEEDAKKGGHIAATLYMIENFKIEYNPMIKPRTVCVKPKLLGGAPRKLPVPKRIALLNGMEQPPLQVKKELQIDYEAQAETILKAPFEMLVLSLGRQWSEVATGTKQTTLDVAFDEVKVKEEQSVQKEEDLEDEFQQLLQSQQRNI
jgi:DNA polymerase elongation subunit (family B)